MPALTVKVGEFARSQWMTRLRSQCPPACGFLAIRLLRGASSQTAYAKLIGRLAVAGLSSLAQQAQTFFPGAKTCATKHQQMAVKTLCRDIPQVRHSGKLPFHPAPGPRLGDQPARTHQLARQPVTQPCTQPPPQRHISGLLRILELENPGHFGRMPRRGGDTVDRAREPSQAHHTLKETRAWQAAGALTNDQ